MTAVDLQFLQVQPNVLEVGQTLKALFDEKADWSTVKNYIQCVFEVENENEVSGPGIFERAPV